MSLMTIALIDADIFTYSFGNSTDDYGNPLKWHFVAARMEDQIRAIVKGAGADSYNLYLTGKGNFREEVATIKKYKGNRPKTKPHHYQRVRDYLVKFRKAKVIEGMEADDAISIRQMEDYNEQVGIVIDYFDSEVTRETFSEDYTFEDDGPTQLTTIICSIDKDLDMVPGWHYNWIKDEKYYIDEIDGLRNFYKQLLTGDTVDNIPGLYGVGRSSSILKHLDGMGTELEFYGLVKIHYEKRFGSYWWQFLVENAQLLWMLRKEPEEQYEGYWNRDGDPRIKSTWTEYSIGTVPEKEVECRLEELNKQLEGLNWKTELKNKLNSMD